MVSVETIAEALGWPIGLSDAVSQSKNLIAYRFVIVDNSRFEFNEDGHNTMITDDLTTSQTCTPWEEVSACVRAIAAVANVIEAPTEFRLIDSNQVIIVGQSNDKGASLAIITSQLDVEPIEQTPICKQMSDVVSQLKVMAEYLNANGKVALITIFSNGLSSDGDLVEVMKPLEGMPVKIIVRICTVVRDVINFWQSINAQIEIDCFLLYDARTEAASIQETNGWLTYGEPLLRAREFGVILPELDHLDFAPLSHAEIRVVAAAV